MAILDEGGALLWPNPAFGAVFGRDSDELTGVPLAALLALPVALPIGGAFELILESPAGPQRLEARIRALPSGGRRLLLLRVAVAGDRSPVEGQRQREEQLRTAQRKRLARELHDNLGQSLDYLMSQAESLREFLASGRLSLAAACLPPLIAAIQEARHDLDGLGAGAARPVVPPMAEAAGFIDQLGEQLEWLGQLYALPITLDVDPALEALAIPALTQPALLQIIREALGYIHRRSAQPAAQLRCAQVGGALEIAISDLGHGPLAADAGPDRERGLQTLVRRAEEIGGSMTIEQQPDGGYLMWLRAPLQATDAAPARALRVLVVDDSPLFASGLRQLLTARGFHVVGTAASGVDGLERARQLRPDIILMDVNMPDGDGISAAAEISRAFPEIQVVMLTVSDEETTLFEALRAGAVGYLLKGLDADELQSRLLGLANGEVALSPGLARRVLRAFSDTTPVESGGDLARLARLTPRQIDVLSLVSQGQTYKEIGRVLGYSERSIKYFMGSIIRQLQLESRADAISYARRLMERGVWPPPAPW